MRRTPDPLIARAAEAFVRCYGRSPTACGVGPGRVEILGNHLSGREGLARRVGRIVTNHLSLANVLDQIAVTIAFVREHSVFPADHSFDLGVDLLGSCAGIGDAGSLFHGRIFRMKAHDRHTAAAGNKGKNH